MSALGLGSCSSAELPSPNHPPELPADSPATGSWSAYTQSPVPVSLSGEDARTLSNCEVIDAGLMRVAHKLAEHQATHQALMDNDEVSFELRAAGVPQVWPRAWGAQGDADSMEIEPAVKDWLASFSDEGERRCGIGRSRTPDGQEVVAVLALDALADLNPVPRTARTGQWLTIDAQLLEPASDADVIVLGPRGLPKRVPASLSGGRVRARVALAEPGAWAIQVLPDFASGPRPALEVTVFADESPPEDFRSLAVPGEDAAEGIDSDALAMLAMLNAARQKEGLPPLLGDPRLAKAAERHAQAMLKVRKVAHNLGDGSPMERLQLAGVSPSIAGENVARASTVQRAHRALWASPSHRGNLLDRRFSHVGISALRDLEGNVWVCQVFAAF